MVNTTEMKFSDMVEVVEESNRIQRILDLQVENMITFILGRLRRAGGYSYQARNNLVKLKRELSNFNANTKQWKN